MKLVRAKDFSGHVNFYIGEVRVGRAVKILSGDPPTLVGYALEMGLPDYGQPPDILIVPDLPEAEATIRRKLNGR